MIRTTREFIRHYDTIVVEIKIKGENKTYLKTIVPNSDDYCDPDPHNEYEELFFKTALETDCGKHVAVNHILWVRKKEVLPNTHSKYYEVTKYYGERGFFIKRIELLKTCPVYIIEENKK